MGTGFGHYKLTVLAKVRIGAIALLLLSAGLIGGAEGSVSYGEFEIFLFDKGYEYYLSYQPDKAAEAFNIFLKAYPESAAKDAAMFWLGKCLLRMKSYEEAEKTFSEIKRQFPESPFVPFAEKELETVKRMNSVGKADEASSDRGSVGYAHDAEEKRMREIDTMGGKALEERDAFKTSLEEEKRKTEDMRSRITELEGREVELKALISKIEEHNNEEKRRGDGTGTGGGKEALALGDRGGAEKKTEETRGDTKEGSGRETAAIRIGDKRFPLSLVLDYMAHSSSAISRLGVREVLWRNGNIYEDFVNEQILYEEAKRSKVAEEPDKQRELVEKYRLVAEESDYLVRYLAIGGLIDRRIKGLPEERVVESLHVRYTEGDKQEKLLLATELQQLAKSGKSFEDIYKSYPRAVRYGMIGFQDLQGWIKERIELLQDGDVSAVWTKDGYMILKPVLKKLSYSPLEVMGDRRGDEIRVFIRQWIEELRKGVGEIEILRSE